MEKYQTFRAVSIQQFIEAGYEPPSEFTCDTCPRMQVGICRFMFDMYNTNGDCIAMK